MKYHYLIFVFLLLAACTAAPATEPTDTADPIDDTQQVREAPQGSENDFNVDREADIVTYEMTGENFAFFMDGIRNPELRVEEGQTVRIVFESTDGFHDWVLDEFDAATEQVNPEDGTTTVEFVADQVGTFEYYCSVGSHRANGMFGSFVVE